MEGPFYPDVFARHGIVLVAPEAAEREYVHGRYMSELVAGTFRPETRDGILTIVDRMRARDGIEGVVLGGTELPLLRREAADPGIAVLDTTRIHVDRAVGQLL